MAKFHFTPFKGKTSHRGLAIAALAVAASCGADSLPGDAPEASSPEAQDVKPRQASASMKAPMPKDLRAAYIAAVQQGASEAYAAIAIEPGRIQVENAAHGFVTNLDRAGAQLSSDAEAWSLSMRASGLGCEGAMAALPEAEPEAEGNRVRYGHEGMEAWYVNGPLGLEQGFIVPQAPGCSGPKVVTLELGGALHAELEDADGDGRGEALRLVNAEGRASLAYTDLFVKDAQGKALAAWLTVEAGQVSIHVDDAEAVYPVEIDPLIGILQTKLLASDGVEQDYLGISVALSGDTALVGAEGRDDKGTFSGAAYVFVRSGGAWTQKDKLLASDGAEGDTFGTSVALWGDTALVGAEADDDKGENSGSVYVFVRSGGVWTQQAKLLAGDGSMNRFFGASVSLSGDTALVGADNLGTGSAYVFVRSGGVWTQQAKLLTNDGLSDNGFGASVSLSGDTALVSAYNDDVKGSDVGAAYVFVRSGGVWTQQAKLYASGGAAFDRFGFSVSLSGDTALMGSIYNKDKGFESGAAYVFVRSGGVWTQQAKLLASDGGPGQIFGRSVAISGDKALVGAYESAYLFLRSNGMWAQQSKMLASNGMVYGEYFGGSVALSSDTALVRASGDGTTATEAGAAYAYFLRQGMIGDPCTAGTDCPGGFCVDGVCCNTACGGGAIDCLACSVAKGAAVNGTCSVASQGAICRSPSAPCDAPEVCDGVSVTCPADAMHGSGTVYRAPVDACDAAETCNGVSELCPADAKLKSGTECRPLAGDCDVVEKCDGVSNACPVDITKKAGILCRASAGVCDVLENCDGLNGACPADVKVAAGTQCRAAGSGACEAAELCDGVNSACPEDINKPAGTSCRAVAGPCDIAESCNGIDAGCPDDAVADVTTTCRAPAGLCDIPEKCDGVTKVCTPDVLAPLGAPCRPVAGACDVAETCDGILADCPANESAPDGTTCKGGVCEDGVCVNGSGAGGSGGAGGNGGAGGSGGGSNVVEAKPQPANGCALRPASDWSDVSFGATGVMALGLLARRRRRVARA